MGHALASVQWVLLLLSVITGTAAAYAGLPEVFLQGGVDSGLLIAVVYLGALSATAIGGTALLAYHSRSAYQVYMVGVAILLALSFVTVFDLAGYFRIPALLAAGSAAAASLPDGRTVL